MKPPRGSRWVASCIHGETARGSGILNNELYVGRIAMYEERVENCDPDSRDIKESLRARLSANLLPEYQADLRKALAARAALDAPDAIHHNGVIYAEMAGRA